MDDLIYSSATVLAQMIRDWKVSSVEVIEAHIERIEAVNPKLNAVVQLGTEAALNRAREADEALARGESWGPLHGVPLTTKDAVEISGAVSASGTKGRASYVAALDATVITRLQGAGGIMLASTNVPELCLAGESDNLVYGRTSNPYDLSRTPGGSSGGEAAIIAAGGSPLGLGSDVGGSIRLPAHFCGIAGIKPTTGRVPTTGHWPPLDGLLRPMFQIGPMARSVEDLALALPIISGVDWRDPYTVPFALADASEIDVRTLKVAFFTDSGGAPVGADTKATVTSAVQVLQDAGASVEEARPTGIEEAHDLFLAVLRADAGAGVRRLLGEAGTSETHPLLQRWQQLEGETPLSGPEFAELLESLDAFRSKTLAFMERYDAVLCPTWATPAAPHGTVFDEWPGVSFTHQFNLNGWPAAVVRAGTSYEGLPIGVQVAARPWREDVALVIAQRIEEALGGWKQPKGSWSPRL